MNTFEIIIIIGACRYAWLTMRYFINYLIYRQKIKKEKQRKHPRASYEIIPKPKFFINQN